jgi:hypothetical protein
MAAEQVSRFLLCGGSRGRGRSQPGLHHQLGDSQIYDPFKEGSCGLVTLPLAVLSFYRLILTNKFYFQREFYCSISGKPFYASCIKHVDTILKN